VSAELEGAFPNLAADGYTVASPKTQAYNCVAWAAGDASRWWEPGIYWPGPTGDDLAALTGLFAALGYVPCAGDELEAGYEKVALYADDQGNWTHAALQLPDGWWTSKLGPDEDILHRTPQALLGDLYGQVREICSVRRRPGRAARSERYRRVAGRRRRVPKAQPSTGQVLAPSRALNAGPPFSRLGSAWIAASRGSGSSSNSSGRTKVSERQSSKVWCRPAGARKSWG
jgi:hypothetical protein